MYNLVFKKNNVVILDDNRLWWQLRNFFSQKINLYIYNLGWKQDIIVTLDDYLLSWWLRNCLVKKKLYKYNLGLKKSFVNIRRLFAIM